MCRRAKGVLHTLGNARIVAQQDASQPETLLRWHRRGFRLFWKFKSRSRDGRPRLVPDTLALIQQMAKDNRLWGAVRIRGELLKLDIQVARATIQKYLRRIRPQRAPNQT